MRVGLTQTYARFNLRDPNQVLALLNELCNAQK
jgi:hypothetical protein